MYSKCTKIFKIEIIFLLFFFYSQTPLVSSSCPLGLFIPLSWLYFSPYHLSPFTTYVLYICAFCMLASLVPQTIKNLPTMWETWVWSLTQEDALGKGMATHSIILAWRIPWTEEPGRLQSMGSQSRTWLSDLTLSFSFCILSLSSGVVNSTNAEVFSVLVTVLDT